MSQKQLIDYAFAKAESEYTRLHGTAPSKTQAAEFISQQISDRDFGYGEKSLRILHKQAQNSDVRIGNTQVVQRLSEFLGYDDYVDFATRNAQPIPEDDVQQENSIEQKVHRATKQESTNKSKRNSTMQAIVITLVAVVIGFGSLAFYLDEREEVEWMRWNGEHYEITEFDKAAYRREEIEVVDQYRLQNFKRLDLECDDVFFTPSGEPLAWYHKNDFGELELYSQAGKHPVLDDQLKPITQYMIDKYICSEND
jgi:hypothetical protein